MSSEIMAPVKSDLEPAVHDDVDLLQLARLNTMNINGLSKQMGLLNDRMDQIVARMDSHDNRLEILEHNTTIKRVRMVCFDQKTKTAYEKALAELQAEE